MSKSATKAKRRYNKSAYRRYEFSVNIDSKLNYILERYKENHNMSNLIKSLLCKYFEIELDDLYAPYHFGTENGETIHIPNSELDCIFEKLNLK